jgi:hypothetical protein
MVLETATCAVASCRAGRIAAWTLRMKKTIEVLKLVALVLTSSFIGVLLGEMLWHFFAAADSDKRVPWDRKIMFFSGADTIFKNKGDIFTYSSHNDIRSLSVFFSDDSYNVAYDYRFRTNNYGLVQDTDIVAEKNSMLLLGDSFTEGQGAEPWFRQVAPGINSLGYQPINGGLLGTGFEQWSKLDEYLLSNNILVKKLIIIFISDDYRRVTWNFPTSSLQCLSNLERCGNNEFMNESMLRLPSTEDLPVWVNKIRESRRQILEKERIKERIRKLFPASYQIFHFLHTYSSEQRSRDAIAEIIRRHGPENVTFIHLPDKYELKAPSGPGSRARRFIEEAGGKLFDGFDLCGLADSDFHIMDGHPTAQGYAKIASCVSRVISLQEGAV